MKIITKNSDYAVRAICKLAKERDFISTRNLAETTAIPLPYLRRILGTLAQARIIETKEGIEGGIKLRKNPSEITLTEIIKLFQGGLQISECLFRKKLCPNRTTCILRKKLIKTEKMLSKEFEKITISSLT
ncbi:MAG TPA: Rrf2 family transcriptional regulator [bacterium]|nr:Rrf2 family transcriptional regulator [bacterium]